ncbi:unnamed protein product [Phyllotreta striolata]|uniref:CDK5RAP1-like protein n=1 Tax=Phyllotreta striolata TaxID=444603 RepID=A0A9N9TKJ9_PHYSR|nr:unnamed protein product [Phyllotreta striolata]
MINLRKLLTFSAQICNTTRGKATSSSVVNKFKEKLDNGPNLVNFIQPEQTDYNPQTEENPPYYKPDELQAKRKVYFDIYGCQMNVNDVEIVWSIMKNNNFDKTSDLLEADVILLMTCAIRESAEEKIWARLDYIRGLRKLSRSTLKLGILGCMAERLKEKLLEKSSIVDLVAGPDSYRHLPRLLALTNNNQKSVNVLLSLEETYADITPVRLNENSVTAFVSIMRGCDNMCTYCIVPFTRGRERSRPVSSILDEVRRLSEEGVKEITLLGQNVNSYRDLSEGEKIGNVTSLASGFKTVYKAKKGGLRFADLLVKVAEIDPELRIRFTSPHPKDFPDDVLEAIRSYPNICKSLHMPAQSGSSTVLERMRRGYTREAYVELIERIRSFIPDVALSSDFICGFCGETDREFEDTLSLIDEIKYNNAFLFPYSMREKTTAHRRYEDDVPTEIKLKRLEAMIKHFRRHAEGINRSQIGRKHLILIEGPSKRSENFLQGRNDQNVKVIVPAVPLPDANGFNSNGIKRGEYVAVRVNSANSQTLKADPLYKTSLKEFYSNVADS